MKMSNEIVVVAVGEVEPRMLVHLCAAIRETIERACRVGEAMPVPQGAFDSRRRQYAADLLLGHVVVPLGAERALAVADLDLYVPDLNFVFGLAQPRARRAIIALPRLRPTFYGERENDALFHKRVLKEAVHELGHTYGLGHCREPRCVMHFSNWIGDTDFKRAEWCDRCRKQIEW